MINYSMLYPRNTKTRRAVSLDGMWKFKFDWDSTGLKDDWINGLPTPDLMPVPASFADFYTDKDSREYTGDFWYETDVFVPEEWRGKSIQLRFGCATHRAAIYVNGVMITSHEGGFLPFVADITEVSEYNSMNKVVVLMNNELSETTIPYGRTITLENGKKMTRPFFDFYNYSGLQRSVSLLALPKESVFDYTVSFELAGKDAKVFYSVFTTGTHNVSVILKDEAGNEAAKAEGKEGVLNVPDAHLWNVMNSYLYELTIQIRDGSVILDEYIAEVGIRTVEVKGTDILINDSPVYLKGFGKHEDSDIVGRGFNIGVMKRDFELMKWIGANSFRTSHYPYSEEFYRMADREGILVIDEVPAVGLFDHSLSNVVAFSGEKTEFFERESIPKLLKNHLQAIEEMVVRDKNYACVFAWSLLNEPDTSNEAARPYFKELFDLTHVLDIQKRPRTFALIANSLPGTCKCFNFSDFISLNRYYGWYLQGGYMMVNAEASLRDELKKWQKLKLNKPFVFTEYGADTNDAEHKLPSVMWSQEYQCEFLDTYHKVFDEFDFVKGEQIWNFADFQTAEGLTRMNGNRKGIFTRQRQPKDAAYGLKKRWESLPLNYKSQTGN